MSIHPTAVIDPQAEVHSSAVIGPYVVIEGRVQIGPECRIASSAVILGNTTIGAGCQIHAHSVIGDTPQDRAFHGGATFCRIGEACIIREGATVHRGTADGTETVIGARCFLMTNSHVGHNCVLADDVMLVSGALLGGYVQIGSRAVISGNAAVHQFVRIGELAIVSGLGKIVQDVPPFFMTDREGAVAGLNTVGLKRAGYSAEDRRELKEAYRVIYRSGMSHALAIETLTASTTTDAGRRLLQFLSTDSRRGITKDSQRQSR